MGIFETLLSKIASTSGGNIMQVLDMCAAPGSKTFQILELLHSGAAPATGLVVANDTDAKRCNLLAHQTKRMCRHGAPAVSLLAAHLPCLSSALTCNSHVRLRHAVNVDLPGVRSAYSRCTALQCQSVAHLCPALLGLSRPINSAH